MDKRAILFRDDRQVNEDQGETQLPPAANEVWDKFAAGEYLPNSESEIAEKQAEIQRDVDRAFKAFDWSLLNEIIQNPGKYAADADDSVLDSILIGGSRLGGLPDLPVGSEWPRWQGLIIPLIAQINLEESSSRPSMLPGSGCLYIFGLYSCGASVPYVALHLSCEDRLLRCPRPESADVWRSNAVETFHLSVNPTTRLAKASSAFEKDDDEVRAWLLGAEIEGYGDASKVAKDEGLDGNDWMFLFSSKLKSYEDSGPAEFHLLARESEIRDRTFSNLHPFVILC